MCQILTQPSALNYSNFRVHLRRQKEKDDDDAGEKCGQLNLLVHGPGGGGREGRFHKQILKKVEVFFYPLLSYFRKNIAV